MFKVFQASVVFLAMGALCLPGSPAAAADLSMPSLKDDPWSAPVPVAAGPCYLRADVGRSWSQGPDARYDGSPDPDVLGGVLDAGWFGELGGGCGSGSRGWRADVTFGLREAVDFEGDAVQPGPTATRLSTDVRTYTFMVNAYYDLGNLNGVVPYVGAGVGVAHHRMGSVRGDAGPTSQSGGDSTGLAWSLMAGLAYQLNERAILDIGYRYVDLGSVRSDRDPVLPRLELDDLHAHEIKIGLRYHLGTTGPSAR